MTWRRRIRSAAEHVVGRPFLVRDRVLLAVSDDGVAWRKDPAVRLTYPSHGLAHMTYFTGRDRLGRTWLRASVHDRDTDTWHTEIGRPGQPAREWWDARSAGLTHLYAPCWHDGRVYGVSVAPGLRPAVVCFTTDGDELPHERVDQEWEQLARFPVVQDLCLVRADGGHHAWASAGPADTALHIHHWRSLDAVEWRYEGDVLSAPEPGRSFEVVNNPSIVPAGDGWRMYFRTGDRPVLNNVIRSATSADLRSWRHEDGVRVAAGGRWDSHGVGFPHVWHEPGRGWSMLYAGYWGRVAAAEETARHWEEIGGGVAV